MLIALLLKTIFILSSTLLFGFLYRCRGGAIALGSTTLARIVFWALPITIFLEIACYVHNFPWYYGLLAGLLSYIGIVFGHSSAQADTEKAYVSMGLIVALRLFAIMIPFWIYPFSKFYLLLSIGYTLISAIAGYALCHFSYYLANKGITLKIFNLPLVYTVPSSEWEEIFIGCLYGFIFACFSYVY